MNCPVCTMQDLVMSDRQGIEIDYCPKCRGVWLDRGELDKIIERSAEKSAPAPYQQPPQYQQQPHEGYHGKDYKKQKSWLGELFD